MAIGSVKELIDYERETIKIAQKYGGGSGTVDLGLIADNYNPDRTTSYPVNDMVVNNGKLYRATNQTKPRAGEFDPTMWTKFDDYDPTQTYNTDQIVVYEGKPYRCTATSVTGDWDATKWVDMSSYFTEYDEASTNYNPVGTLVEYDGDFYRSSTFTPTGGVGEFNTSNWTETTVEEVINALKPIPVFVPQFTTDASGCVWLESPAMEGIREPFSIFIQHDGAFNGFTGRVEVVHKYVNDGSPSYTHHDYIGFKFYDGNGDALANWSSVQNLGMTAGIGFLYYAR